MVGQTGSFDILQWSVWLVFSGERADNHAISTLTDWIDADMIIKYKTKYFLSMNLEVIEDVYRNAYFVQY